MSRREAECRLPRMKQPYFVVCAASCVQPWGSWTRGNQELGRAEDMGGQPGRPLTSGAGRNLVGTMDFGARMPEHKSRLLPAVCPVSQFPHLEYGHNNSGYLTEW